MKNKMVLFILIMQILFQSYKSDMGTDEIKLPFKVITEFSYTSQDQQAYFLIRDVFEYDDFWMNLYGSLTDKPFVDLNHNMLLATHGSIDSITETSNNINIYRSSGKKDGYSIGLMRGDFLLIKLKYSSKEILFFETTSKSFPSQKVQPY